jgi:hypothetical protein
MLDQVKLPNLKDKILTDVKTDDVQEETARRRYSNVKKRSSLKVKSKKRK